MAINPKDLVNRISVIQEYIDRVVTESNGAITSVPHSSFPASTIGPALADPTTSEIQSTNLLAQEVVDLLKDHAYNLTRYRKATWNVAGNVPPAGNYGTDVLSRLNDSYRDKLLDFQNLVHDVVTKDDVNSQKMIDFLEDLKNIYISVREDTVTITSCHGSCHSSCHSNCHGSRGRR